MQTSGFVSAGRYERALAHWREVQTAEPDNAEASRMVAALIIERSRQQAGLPPSTALDLALIDSPPPAEPAKMDAADAAVADALSNEITGIRLTRIQQLETAIKGEAANADVFLELARLYLDKGREYEAERLLVRGREATGQDARILSFGEDVTMLRLEKKVSAAERDVELEDTPQSQAALAQLVKERDRIETEIFRERTRREPDNLALRYELGRRLVRAGKPDQAQPLLAEALHDPSSRCHAAFELAGCALEAGQAPEALRYYRQAAAAATQTGQSQCQAEALLQAARLAGRSKLLRLARRYLGQLLRLDPHHRAGAALARSLERGAV